MAILTDLHGVLEPCGCTRSSAGGADRIAALLGTLRRTDPALVVVLAGDLLFPAAAAEPERAQADAQAQLKADAWVELIQRLKVSAIVPGQRDFERGGRALASLARRGGVAILGTQAPPEGLERLSPEVLVRAGARKIALTTRARVSEHADLTFAFQNGEQRPGDSATGARLVIHSGLVPARSFAHVRDGVLHVSAGQDGEEVLLLKLWPDAGPQAVWQLASTVAGASAQNIARAERHRLTQDQPRDPEVRRMLEQLFARINAQNQALATGSAAAPKRRGRPEPPAFMGARTCAACHTPAYFAWRETPHARAYQTLVARGRELDLDCIGCHVTGFDQEKGAAIGHLDELLGVGCESCHGPGEAHADNPRVRRRSVHRAVPEAKCRVCHDPAHSDGFDDPEKRGRLLVPGHGQAGAHGL